jgi:hypothetical protein
MRDMKTGMYMAYLYHRGLLGANHYYYIAHQFLDHDTTHSAVEYLAKDRRQTTCRFSQKATSTFAYDIGELEGAF